MFVSNPCFITCDDVRALWRHRGGGILSKSSIAMHRPVYDRLLGTTALVSLTGRLSLGGVLLFGGLAMGSGSAFAQCVTAGGAANCAGPTNNANFGPQGQNFTINIGTPADAQVTGGVSLSNGAFSGTLNTSAGSTIASPPGNGIFFNAGSVNINSSTTAAINAAASGILAFATTGDSVVTNSAPLTVGSAGNPNPGIFASSSSGATNVTNTGAISGNGFGLLTTGIYAAVTGGHARNQFRRQYRQYRNGCQ